MEVLFLDDDYDLREVMRDLLASLGHECTSVASCEELPGLGAALEHFQLALVDINLGADKQSGIDAYRWLCDQRFRGKVVFLTGHGRRHPLVTGAAGLGHVQVLQKPVSVDALLAVFADVEAELDAAR